MFRVLTLIGFTFVFIHLHVTGNISKYINMKYSWISFSTIFVLLTLTIAEMVFYWRGEEKHEHVHCECGHDHGTHNHKRSLWWYLLYFLPVITILCLPVATLDSNIVEKKGFNFSIYDKNDPYSSHQFLQPNTSSFYGQEAYDEMMQKEFKKYGTKNTLNLEDEEFLNAMETIYDFPGEFVGKTISMKGFMYHTNELQKNQYFLFRFGIIHCIADSGVFGMLVDFPKDVSYKNDDWVKITGKIDTMYYQPFKKTIPVIHVTKVVTISKPSNPYVYRNNQ